MTRTCVSASVMPPLTYGRLPNCARWQGECLPRQGTNSAGLDRITQQLNGLALRMLVKQRQKCVADRRTPRRRLLQRLLHRSLMAGWYCNPSLPQHHVSHEPRTVTMAIIAMKSITSDSSSRKRARRRPGPYRWLRPHHPDSRPRH